MEVKDKKCNICGKGGNVGKAMAQLQVRPVELYEIVFPEEHERTVMGLIKPATDLGMYGKKWAKYIRWIVKKLGLQPPITDFKPSFLPPNPGVTALALGTKKDKINWNLKPGPQSFYDDGSIPRENI